MTSMAAKPTVYAVNNGDNCWWIQSHKFTRLLNCVLNYDTS